MTMKNKEKIIKLKYNKVRHLGKWILFIEKWNKHTYLDLEKLIIWSRAVTMKNKYFKSL